MADNGAQENGERRGSVQPRKVDSPEQDWKAVFTDAVLTARARGIEGFEAGARKSVPFGITIGCAVATLGGFARGKNGYWNDVIIQGAYSFMLLGFAGVILTSIVGSLVGAIVCACRAAYLTIRECRDSSGDGFSRSLYATLKSDRGQHAHAPRT
jgi:hypothetical protein